MAAAVGRLGAEISAAFPRGVVLAAVVPGAVPFVADLVRRLAIPVEVAFLALRPYTPGTGRVRLTLDLDLDIHSRDVLVVEEIVDTGLTLNYVLSELAGRRPRRLEACALVDRRRRRIAPVEVAFRGLESEEDLILGYGLAHRGWFANLSGLVAGEPADLEAATDAQLSAIWAQAAGLVDRRHG